MKRRGFLGTLFSLPAAAVAMKVKASQEKVVEPVIEASSGWEPEDASNSSCSAVPCSRFGDEIYRRMVK